MSEQPTKYRVVTPKEWQEMVDKVAGRQREPSPEVLRAFVESLKSPPLNQGVSK